jgi:hypothetical protein
MVRDTEVSVLRGSKFLQEAFTVAAMTAAGKRQGAGLLVGSAEVGKLLGEVEQRILVSPGDGSRALEESGSDGVSGAMVLGLGA